MRSHTSIIAVVAVLAAGAAMPAAAQSSGALDLTVSPDAESLDLDTNFTSVAPGYEPPDRQVSKTEIEVIRPFGDVSDDPLADNPALNEFAGQTRPYDPGVIGLFLGRAKDAILDVDQSTAD